MPLSKIVIKYIFKKRIIYFYTLQYQEDVSCKVLNINLSNVSNEFFTKINHSERLTSLLNKRMGNANWEIFIYLENNIVKGYSFLHFPENLEWHDSLPTRNDEARTVSSFVEPSFRGMGIRGELLKSQKNFCLIKKKKLWCVIEDINESSIKSTKKSGIILTRKNYLLKFLGRNIFSILKNPFKVFLLLGKKRAKR